LSSFSLAIFLMSKLTLSIRQQSQWFERDNQTLYLSERCYVGKYCFSNPSLWRHCNHCNLSFAVPTCSGTEYTSLVPDEDTFVQIDILPSLTLHNWA
jgi:hypothetical protein